SWFTFAGEQKRAAGTRYELRAGAADPTLPPAEPGVIRRFSNGSPFPAPDVDLRLVAPDGTVEHARFFLADEAFVPVSPGIMRNADGTGFFLLPASGSTMPGGTYRLTFTYARDGNGVDPILSRGGSTTAETVVIDVAGSDTIEIVPSQAVLIQSTSGAEGNFEVVVPWPAGGMAHYWRNNDDPAFPWSPPFLFGATAGAVDAVSLIESTDGNLQLIARIGDRLAHFQRSGDLWSSPTYFASGVAGTPSLIQGHSGSPGNFELVTPMAAGGLAHFWRNSQTLQWSMSTAFAESVGVISDACLIQSTFGNLEVVARIGDQLAHFWRDASSQAWSEPDFFASGISGTPSFIQGRFGSPGNFEVVAPLASGGMVQLSRDNQTLVWSQPVTFGSGSVRSVSLIHSSFGNLEIVALAAGSLGHYWRQSVAPWTWFGSDPVGG
ncbi:MAG: hypothetical protein ACRD3J_10640, partial [Thermoanaerobaculia bacterium]